MTSPPSAQSKTARSRVVSASPPTAVWQGFDDQEGRIVDLHDVSFHEGRIVVHGVSHEMEDALRTLLQPYSEFVDSEIIRQRFDDLFAFTAEPLRWSECVRIEERATCFLSPWHIDNAYHLHANSLLPMFANLRQGGLLDAPRLLYLFPGDRKRNANAVVLWELMAKMFGGAVEDFAALASAGGRVGFRHIRWGRGPHLLYLRDVRATPFVGAADDYRSWALHTLGVPERPAATGADRPRVLYMARTGPRSIANRDVLMQAFANAGLDVRVFDAWSETDPAALAAMLHATDMLIGVHGAALIHMAYMPRGSMVVELSPPTHVDSAVFPHAAYHFGQRYVRIALPGPREPAGGRVLSRNDATAIAGRVVDEWETRHRPRSITVRSLGTGKWGNEVFWYMFGKTYARRYGLEFQTGPWAGNLLIGANDPPVRRDLPDVEEKTEHGIFDTRIPHGPPMGDVNFTGYFQYHTSHYAPDRDYITSLLQPSADIEAVLGPRWQAIRTRGGTVVALHLRRGDFGFEYFYRAPTRWYLEWLERVWPELDRPLLYIATDEPDTVLKDFAAYQPLSARDFGPPLPQYDFYRDFYALQHSDVIAISNSSFSFSAAMVNTGLQRAFRPHLPSQRLVPFDPWNDKPLQQEPAFRVERYPWRPELWRPTPARKRWIAFARFHAKGARRWARQSIRLTARRARESLRWVRRFMR